MKVWIAWLHLIWVDVVLRTGGYEALRNRLSGRAVCSEGEGNMEGVERWRQAMDLACVLYPRPVRCLQRSAALALLLRRKRIAAEFVIGIQQVPFFAHAWVEVAGQVVNDFSSYPDRLHVIDRA